MLRLIPQYYLARSLPIDGSVKPGRAILLAILSVTRYYVYLRV